MIFTLPAQVRTVFGKRVRTLRKQGILPAVLYGGGKKNIALSIIEHAFEKIRKSAGVSSLVELRIEGEGAENVLIQDVDYDPLTRKPRHMDFLRV
jgi:large subunit ribosomal protein L25